MADFSTDVGGCPVSVSLGNMVKEKAGAYLVPQFDTTVVFGGVAGAIANAGAMAGMKEFAAFMDKNGPLAFGTVWPVKSQGGNSDWLLNAISVKSGDETAFDVIREVTYRAMKFCGENGIDKLVLPALGTGALRELTDEQSAKAMLSGIDKYAAEGGKPVAAAFMFLPNTDGQLLLAAFKKVLNAKSYENVAPEKAAGAIDLGRWAALQDLDAAANAEFARKQAERLPQGIPISKPLRFKTKAQP